jgi:serine/threonine protein phosphatase 1
LGFLVVGDIHGCYFTFKSLLKEHWFPEKDSLVLVGDLLNKGPHSAKAWRLWQKINTDYPNKVVLLRGNHEQHFLENYRLKTVNHSHLRLCEQFREKGISAKRLAQEIRHLPLHWQNETLLVSHAGISEEAIDPFNLLEPHNLLQNRKPLKSLSRVQIIGHNIISKGKPLFKPQENAWYIDTGVWCNQFLSALYFEDGQLIPKVIQVARKYRDNPSV